MANYNRAEEIARIEKDWAENPRWKNVKRTYSAEDVVRLRGSVKIENTIARRGAEKLWDLVNRTAKKGYVNCLGALTGGQAVQQVKAGIEAIYLSGWQVAADNNTGMTMYPDQSLYPVNSVPAVVQRINNSFRRADQIQWKSDVSPDDESYIDYFAPIVADAEAGFGGVLNAYELMKAMIEAGASGVHFEDQLASVKKWSTGRSKQAWTTRRRFRSRMPRRRYSISPRKVPRKTASSHSTRRSNNRST